MVSCYYHPHHKIPHLCIMKYLPPLSCKIKNFSFGFWPIRIAQVKRPCSNSHSLFPAINQTNNVNFHGLVFSHNPHPNPLSLFILLQTPLDPQALSSQTQEPSLHDQSFSRKWSRSSRPSCHCCEARSRVQGPRTRRACSGED